MLQNPFSVNPPTTRSENFKRRKYRREVNAPAQEYEMEKQSHLGDVLADSRGLGGEEQNQENSQMLGSLDLSRPRKTFREEGGINGQGKNGMALPHRKGYWRGL